MTSENIQDRGESLFHTPNPEELKADARNVPAEQRHQSQHEANVQADAQPSGENVDNPTPDLNDTNEPALGDRQMIRANISGH